MKKLRLLLFPNCNRSCPGCCNKDWDLKALPVIQDYHGWDLAMLTGGEPMLNPKLVIEVAARFPLETQTIVYTAKVDDPDDVFAVLAAVDGMTITLHEPSDVSSFWQFIDCCAEIGQFKSMRLNVFEGIEGDFSRLDNWKVKTGIKWIKNCPLPADEVFLRLA